MKKFFLTGICLSWLCYAFSQTPQTIPQKLKYFFAPVDKAQTQTGYLLDLAPGFENPQGFSGSPTDTVHSDIDRLGALYGQLTNSKCSPNAMLPSANVYLQKLNDYGLKIHRFGSE